MARNSSGSANRPWGARGEQQQEKVSISTTSKGPAKTQLGRLSKHAPRAQQRACQLPTAQAQFPALMAFPSQPRKRTKPGLYNAAKHSPGAPPRLSGYTHRSWPSCFSKAPQPEATFQPRARESRKPLLNSPRSSRDLKAKSIHTAVWPRSFPSAKGGSLQDL